jgi:hypothetical protein
MITNRIIPVACGSLQEIFTRGLLVRGLATILIGRKILEDPREILDTHE